MRLINVNILIKGSIFSVKGEYRPHVYLSEEEKKYINNAYWPTGPYKWMPYKYQGSIEGFEKVDVCYIYTSYGDMWKLKDVIIDNVRKEIRFETCKLTTR